MKNLKLEEKEIDYLYKLLSMSTEDLQAFTILEKMFEQQLMLRPEFTIREKIIVSTNKAISSNIVDGLTSDEEINNLNERFKGKYFDCYEHLTQFNRKEYLACSPDGEKTYINYETSLSSANKAVYLWCLGKLEEAKRIYPDIRSFK